MYCSIFRRYEIEEWEKQVQSGNYENIVSLAVEYLNGDVIEKATEKGADLMLKAASLGKEDAAKNVSIMYEDGDGVPKNFEESEKWAVIAAKGGITDRLYWIGRDYQDGNLEFGRQVDINKAIEYFTICANHNDSNALNSLGVIYEYGKSGIKDRGKALQYYIKSAELGEPVAFRNLLSLYKEIGIYESDIYQKHSGLISKFVEQEIPEAYYLHAKAYQYGWGNADESEEKYVQYVEKAAIGGYVLAQGDLGDWYHTGAHGKDKDNDIAIGWYILAAQKGLIRAYLDTGMIYLERKGSKEDLKKGLDWIEQYLDTESNYFSREEVINLIIPYYMNLEMYAELVNLMRKLYEQGINGSQPAYMLGFANDHGIGIPVNRQIARHYYQQAANMGHKGAIEALQKL